MLITLRYIQFYVDCIASEDNASLLFYLASKAKTVRDAEGDEYSVVSVPNPVKCVIAEGLPQNLYYLSEIAQRIIQNRAKARSWSLVSLPPGKVKLPADILKPLANAETATKVRQVVPRNNLICVDDVADSEDRLCPGRSLG